LNLFPRADPEHFLLGRKFYEAGQLPLPLQKGISAALSTRLTNLANTSVVPAARVRPLVKNAVITSYARLQIQSGGDTIRTASSSPEDDAADSRDASFVRVRDPCSADCSCSIAIQYDLMVDKHARSHRRRPEFIWRTHFGQLQHLVELELPADPALHLPSPRTFVLAGIRQCRSSPGRPGTRFHHYEEHGALEFVDVTTIDNLVGRVKRDADSHRYFIVDRSGRPLRVDEPVEDDDDPAP
jgi:hypothetical protein